MMNLMYAVFQTGGKQYRVELGSRVDVEKLEKSPGEEIEFTEVLLVSDSGDLKIGRPYVNGATVVAKVIAQKKGKKLKNDQKAQIGAARDRLAKAQSVQRFKEAAKQGGKEQ